MIEFFLILICLVMNALLAGSETAFIAVSRPSLKGMAKKGNEEAQLLLRLHENPERTLSVIQIGITFVGALAAAVGGAGAEETIAPWISSYFQISKTLADFFSILIIVIPLTYINVVIGELVPKTFALRRPLFLASKVAPWLHLFNRILAPLVASFEWSTKKIVNFFPKRHTAQEELPQSEISAEIDVLSPKNRQYVINILKIEKTTIGKIMIPWPEVTYIQANQSIEQVEEAIISSGHTRLPVIKDHEVIGIVNAKEFLAYQKTNKTNWPSIIRSTIKLSENTFILNSLQMMQEKCTHMVIVYRKEIKMGIVTMEDIFEEIIGDIYDEDDDGMLKEILDSIRFKKS